ncbi:MAG: hypothetical protein KKE31_01310 [Planctomycetes bacterium]|nr:hypothetical protein [Planctomycetota bacterium]
MNKLIKKSVFVLITAVFLLNAVNIPLYIHLAEHKSDAEHDHDKCPICQHAAINKTKAVIPNIVAIFELPQVIYTDVYVPETFVKSFDFLIPYLRAPPA